MSVSPQCVRGASRQGTRPEPSEAATYALPNWRGSDVLWWKAHESSGLDREVTALLAVAIGISMRTTSYQTLLLTVFLLTACGGGGSSGGGGDLTPPTIASASFVGSGGSPVPGDVLVLFFSEDVTSVAGAILDDSDLTLSSGTLGSVSTPPTQITPRTLSIDLGNGTSFVPGTDTISLNANNDAVRDLSGNLGVSGAPQVITAGDGDIPSIDSLTLNGIDAELNGTGPAGGTLQTPNSGFSIDLTFSDPSSAIDPALTQIAANVTVTVGGIIRAAGTSLTDALTLSTGTGSASFLVPANVLFALGAVTITTFVTDTSGMISNPATFSFLVTDPTAALRPFETPQTWFLDVSRDIESFSTTTSGGAVTGISIIDGANGIADIEDLFTVMGLFSSAPIANVSGIMDSNEVVMSRIQTQVLSDLTALFSGVAINFTFTAPGTFPSGTSSIAFSSFGFSQICIAGAASTTPSGVLGSALFDPHNAFQNNNCLTDFSGIRLGIFVHTMVRIGYLSGGPTSTFRLTYDPLTSAIGGVAIGDDKPDDAARLLGSLVDGRSNMIDTAIARMAKVVAVVLAHECGHSMGLVTNGAMPIGLYGADPVNFPLSGGLPGGAADGHIENISLFPGGAQNIMSPAISFDAALSSSSGFNSLNLSYLREQALYND